MTVPLLETKNPATVDRIIDSLVLAFSADSSRALALSPPSTVPSVFS